MSDVFNKIGILVKLKVPEDFLKIKETLERIGIANKSNTLFQSCHILHKRGQYAIVHFKELFILDGKQTTITQEDYERRNQIVNLLASWKLLEIVDQQQFEKLKLININKIKILPHNERANWKLISKYTIGQK